MRANESSICLEWEWNHGGAVVGLIAPNLLAIVVKMKSAVAAATVVWLVGFKGLVSAFIVRTDPPLLHCKDSTSTGRAATTTTLFAKRRGKLGSLIEEGVVEMGDFRSKKAPKVRSGGIESQQVSPDLASFMLGKQQPAQSSSSSSSSTNDAVVKGSSGSAPATNTIESKDSLSRRARSAERMGLDEEKAKEVKSIVKELQEAIAKGKDVGTAVDRTLQERLPTNVNKLKQLVKSTSPLDYRLAWIASDAAVCAVGSALHKTIALARLQEVYITLHRNRLQLFEVVRILGPFPNVKNTLSGAAKFVARPQRPQPAGSENQMTITWQSLVDGTGKERYEGGETKLVTLDIMYGDEQLIVARLVNPDIPRGEDRVVFIRDDDMDKTLETLRVL
jgi:hypothetical protein